MVAGTNKASGQRRGKCDSTPYVQPTAHHVHTRVNSTGRRRHHLHRLRRLRVGILRGQVLRNLFRHRLRVCGAAIRAAAVSDGSGIRLSPCGAALSSWAVPGCASQAGCSQSKQSHVASMCKDHVSFTAAIAVKAAFLATEQRRQFCGLAIATHRLPAPDKRCG